MFSSIRAWIRDLYRRRFHSDLIADVIPSRFVAQREFGRDHIPDMSPSLLRELMMSVEVCTDDFYEMTTLFSEFVPGVRPVIFVSEKMFPDSKDKFSLDSSLDNVALLSEQRY